MWDTNQRHGNLGKWCFPGGRFRSCRPGGKEFDLPGIFMDLTAGLLTGSKAPWVLVTQGGGDCSAQCARPEMVRDGFKTPSGSRIYGFQTEHAGRTVARDTARRADFTPPWAVEMLDGSAWGKWRRATHARGIKLEFAGRLLMILT